MYNLKIVHFHSNLGQTHYSGGYKPFQFSAKDNFQQQLKVNVNNGQNILENKLELKCNSIVLLFYL